MTQEKIKPYEGIDVWHMLCCIAKKWWKILIAMIVCAVLTGGFSYYKNAKGLAAAAESGETAESGQEAMVSQALATSEEEILDQSGLSRKAAEEVLYYTNKYYYNKLQYEHQNDYIQNSILMQLDPNKVWTVTLYYDLSISGNGGILEGEDCTLAAAYLARISDAEFYEAIAEELGGGIYSGYLSEVITGSSLDTFTDREEFAVLSGKEDFKIVIRYADREGCEKIARAVKEKIETSIPEVTGEAGAHTIKLVGESEEQKADAELLNEQKNVITALANLSDNVINARTNIEASEEAVFNELLEYYEARDAEKAALFQTTDSGKDEKEADDPEGNQGKSGTKLKPRVSKKYVALGLFLGIFLVAAYEACRYFFSHTLKQKKELEEGYGLTVYDSLDKAVIKLAVENQLEKNGWKTVYHASSENSPAQDEKALQELMEADAVMLEEKINVSSHLEIANLLELCRKLDKPVIGAIVES